MPSTPHDSGSRIAPMPARCPAFGEWEQVLIDIKPEIFWPTLDRIDAADAAADDGDDDTYFYFTNYDGGSPWTPS